jgi:hypothetical protein
MNKKRLYLLVTSITVLGCLYVLFNVANPEKAQTLDVCLFKNVTGIPCPSCGSTHSVLNLLQLDWKRAIDDNPLGFVLLAGLLVLPFWMIYDFAAMRSTFYNFYTLAEAYARKRWVAIPLIALVMANWMWSIYKYTT